VHDGQIVVVVCGEVLAPVPFTVYVVAARVVVVDDVVSGEPREAVYGSERAAGADFLDRMCTFTLNHLLNPRITYDCLAVEANV
jgi:hypothetical protein